MHSSQSNIVVMPSRMAIDEAPNTYFAGYSVLYFEPTTLKGGTKKAIRVDTIRDIQQIVRSNARQKRMIALLQAHKATPSAQNAFLKLLEEPPQNTYFYLVTDQPEQLLPTVRSRCQMLFANKDATVIDIPEEKRSKVEFIAQGDSLQIQKMLNDERYYNQKNTLFAKARNYINAPTYDRLVEIRSFKDDREGALEFLDACLIITSTLLRRTPTTQLLQLADALLDAYTAIELNGNVRLQLMKTML